jgi:sterol desaturase/sphingolipid hydroxylase (fatty acid hydroxylase superfamily)
MFLELDGVARLSQLFHLRDISTAIADGVTRVLGFAFGPAGAERVAHALGLNQLMYSTVATLVWLVALLAVVFLFETLFGPKRSPYTSRTFVQDVLYALFYQGGFYNALIWTAVANVLDPRLAFFRVEVLAQLPPLAHWVIYWISVDFITYWWHRSLHTWKPFWAFHSVHHSQEEMNFLTAYRMHPFEQIGQNLIMVIPLLVMGVPTFRWLPLWVAMNLLEGFQHTALTWGYGKAYFIFVSPRFHAVHHSADPAHFNSNYSKIFSLWDFLFGTGVYTETFPERLGVDGLPVPRTIGQQLLAPFRILSRSRAGQPAASPTAGPARAP